jgi:hypothetical protein
MEIYGGFGLGVAPAAIISMFTLSNVSKVSSIEISGKLVGKRLALTAIVYLDYRGKFFVATYGYNLWYTSSTHGR